MPKSDGNFRHIHDLSFPKTHSVNDFIPCEYGALEYTTIDQAFEAILTSGPGSILIKRDLSDAFRHIPVAQIDQWLLGFWWQDVFYEERFLPFGLRTAPYIFDLFSKALRWMLIAVLSWSIILHYLDDFFAILPPGSDVQLYQWQFDALCLLLGLSVKTFWAISPFFWVSNWIPSICRLAFLPTSFRRGGIC